MYQTMITQLPAERLNCTLHSVGWKQPKQKDTKSGTNVATMQCNIYAIPTVQAELAFEEEMRKNFEKNTYE